MIQIRRYTLEDIPKLIDGVEEYLEGDIGTRNFEHLQKDIVIDRNKLYRILTYRVDDVDFFCSVIEVCDEESPPKLVGGLCGSIAAPMFSSKKMAYDQILYTVPDFNNLRAVRRLIQSYVEWAKGRGAVFCLLRTASGYRPAAFKKLCNRMGFDDFETAFARRL